MRSFMSSALLFRLLCIAIPAFWCFLATSRKISRVFWVYPDLSMSKRAKFLSSSVLFIIFSAFFLTSSSEISSPMWVSLKDMVERTPSFFMSSRRERYSFVFASASSLSWTFSPRMSMVARSPFRFSLFTTFMASPLVLPAIYLLAIKVRSFIVRSESLLFPKVLLRWRLFDKPFHRLFKPRGFHILYTVSDPYRRFIYPYEPSEVYGGRDKDITGRGGVDCLFKFFYLRFFIPGRRKQVFESRIFFKNLFYASRGMGARVNRPCAKEPRRHDARPEGHPAVRKGRAVFHDKDLFPP